MSDDEADVRSAIKTLRGLIALQGVVTPANVSEPIVCALMGWQRVPRSAGCDAHAPEGRIEIKYSMRGFVSCTKEATKKWDYLAWVHAPGRLPKLLLLIPATVMRRAKFSGGTLKVDENRDLLRANTDELRAWRFDIEDVGDIERRLRSKPRTMPPRVAISMIETDMNDLATRLRRRPTPGSEMTASGAAAKLATATRRRSPPRLVGRGDLNQFNGRTFRARLHGVDHTARVTDGVMWIDGVKGVGFRSLSAAGKHLTGRQTNGNVFWRCT